MKVFKIFTILISFSFTIYSQVYQAWVTRFEYGNNNSYNESDFSNPFDPMAIGPNDGLAITGYNYQDYYHYYTESIVLDHCGNLLGYDVWVWAQNIPQDMGYCTAWDQSNNILVGGTAAGEAYALMIKYNSNLTNKICSTIDFQANNSFTEKIGTDNNNNIYLAINTTKYSTSGQQYGIDLIKKDPSGNPICTVSYHDPILQNEVYDMFIDVNNGYGLAPKKQTLC